jgi:hypothetical protein
MLVYVVTFVQDRVDYIVGVYSTREYANDARKLYNDRLGEGDYTFVSEIVMDTTKHFAIIN